MALALEHLYPPPPARFLLTVVATLRSSELKVSLAVSAFAKLISKRTLPALPDELDHSASAGKGGHVAHG